MVGESVTYDVAIKVMGLAIEVGVLADLIKHDPEGVDWFREDLATVNQVLQRNGIEAHPEPESLCPIQMNGIGSFPYSFIHYLRRAYALMRAGKKVTPVSGEEPSPEDDEIIEEITMLMDSHLLCHSDVEGFYVPIQFSEPIIDEELTGGMLGSSQKLLKELVEVAPLIDITLEDGRLSDAQLAALDPETDEGHRFETERIVWLTLFEAATASVEQKTAIMFT